MIKDLFINITMIVTFVYIAGQLNHFYKRCRPFSKQLIIALATGFLSSLLMVFSIQVSDTIILDARHIPIGIAGLYGGPIALLFSTLIMGIFRITYFGVSQASVAALINLLIIGCGSALFIYFVKCSKLVKYIMINSFSAVSIILTIYLLLKDSDKILALIIPYGSVSLIGGFLTYYVCEYVKHSNERFNEMKYHELMTDNLSDLITTQRLGGTFIYVSPSVYRLLGYSSDDLVGKSASNYSHPEDLEHIQSHHRQTLQVATPTIFRHRIKHVDGRFIWFETTAKAIKDKESNVVEIICVSRDISERLKIEEELLESRESMVTILESITDAFYALSSKWKFTYLNKTAENILGKDAKYLIGKSIWDEFPKILGTQVEKGYRRSLEEQVPVVVEEYYSFIDAWYQTRSYPTKDGITVYVHDVSHQKKLQKELENHQNQLTTLIETTPSGILLVNLEGQFIYVNSMAEEILGVKNCSFKST